MIHQYCHKRLKLFNLPYKTLIAYHSHMGNTIKNWVSYRMLPNILIIRNDIHILNLSNTIINIRKALTALYHRIKNRGTMLIYAEIKNQLKITNDAVFVFVNSWLPGLLTNYRKMSLVVASNKFHRTTFEPLLSRPQLHAIQNTKIKAIPVVNARFKRGLQPRIPRVPSIAFSPSENFIWLNECLCLAIPSIQINDTQSFTNLVTYPIIANQRSIPFTNLMVNLFSETCNRALTEEHLSFKQFYKGLTVWLNVNNIYKRFFKKQIKSKFKRRLRRKIEKKTNKRNLEKLFIKNYLLQTKRKYRLLKRSHRQHGLESIMKKKISMILKFLFWFGYLSISHI